MNTVRWGVLSTANIAQGQLIPAIKRARNAEVQAIASRSNKVHEVAERLDIPKAYESYEELLNDPDIDVIYIPLPNHLHKEWIIKAARAGKHVLSEKPVTLTADEAREVVQVCKENNVLFMEAFMYQFHSQHARVREILASGEIGEVKLMKAAFSFYMNPADRDHNIRMDVGKGGGSIYDVGCYCIHSIRNILQEEPREIQVQAEMDEVRKIDLTSIVHMKMQSGIPTVFDCSFDMSFRNEYEIIGTKGRIQVPRAYRPDNNGGEGLIIIEKDNEQRVEKLIADQYALEVEYFSECVLQGKEPIYTGENTIKNMEVIEACYKAIGTKEKVFLNESKR